MMGAWHLLECSECQEGELWIGTTVLSMLECMFH